MNRDWFDRWFVVVLRRLCASVGCRLLGGSSASRRATFDCSRTLERLAMAAALGSL